MWFPVLKAYAKLALRIYCRKVVVNKPEWLTAKGPLLLACNHPNSFLDGMILTTLFHEDVYSLARGDAFRKTWHGNVLRWMNLLPVYRTSEGIENLEHNYTTFEACREVFRRNGIVVIFSEGRCINEWHLRPLRKGTARLATRSWVDGIPLTVLPVGLNYNPFRNFGKNVFVNFGQPLNREDVMLHQTDGRMFLTFNEQLRTDLQKQVYEIALCDKKMQVQKLAIPVPAWKQHLLFLPAVAGFILHAPLYFAGKHLTKIYFNNDHFDSALVGILCLAYPFYLLLGCIMSGLLLGWLAVLLVFFGLPFCAWSCVQLKPQV